MPPPRARRRPPSSRQPATGAGRETEEYQANPEEIDVVEPAVTEAAPAEQPASSESRRGLSGRRSTRRTASASGSQQMASRSSRRVLTPEERLARRRSILLVVKILLLIIVIGGGVFALWYFGMRKTPALIDAETHLADAESKMKAIDLAIKARDSNGAWDSYHAARKTLDVESLAYAKEENPQPDSENLGSVLLASEAYHKRILLDKEFLPRIQRIERDLKAENNERALADKFGRLTKLDDGALAELEKQVGKFMDNPVDPEGGRQDNYVTDYNTMIVGIKNKQLMLQQEKDRRRAAITSVPERDAHQEAELLVKQDRFSDALSKVQEFRTKYKDANFDNVDAFVKSAAKNAWAYASSYAETNYKTFTSPGTSESIRAEALEKARARMQQVIERFGTSKDVSEYIDQANAALQRYQR
jgi:hypothetical protein